MYSIAKTWVVDEYPHIVQPPICSSLYALLLTQAMCTVIFLHSIANLSCRPVPTHYTTANMLFTVVLFRYIISLNPTVPKLCWFWNSYIYTIDRFALSSVLCCTFFTLLYRTSPVQCYNSLLCCKRVLFQWTLLSPLSWCNVFCVLHRPACSAVRMDRCLHCPLTNSKHRFQKL